MVAMEKKCEASENTICDEFENLEESEGQGRRWRDVDNEEENTVSASATTYKYIQVTAAKHHRNST